MSAFLESLNMEMFLRLVLAAVLGGIIGLEREFHGRPAGLRTHILVCLGASTIMVSGQYLHVAGAAGNTIVSDPGRLAAGIMTGIGFLGAGAILRVGDLIRGLTTAACIWFTAAVGVMVGSGHYGLSAAAVLLGLSVLILFPRLERRIPVVLYRSVRVVAAEKSLNSAETGCDRAFERSKIRVQEKSHRWNRDRAEVEIVFQIRVPNPFQSGKLVSELRSIKGISEIHWQ